MAAVRQDLFMRDLRGVERGVAFGEPVAGRDALRVYASLSLAPGLRQVLAAVKRVFDMEARPEQIAAHLGELARDRPGLRVPGAFSGFEMAVRAILGQQVSVAGATTLAGRFCPGVRRADRNAFRSADASLAHAEPHRRRRSGGSGRAGHSRLPREVDRRNGASPV